ncbi:MAG TPA: GMC family oxidoreductase [Terriglobales bacterium]|nr:GMC family oxidoreductase [Terriglobales bacterium]
MKTLPSVDVVIIGGGWTGLLMAKELGTRTALSVVVLERGDKLRPQSDLIAGMDELDYFSRTRVMQDCSRETVTLRHTARDNAYPIRQLASFLPGSGVGGSGEHWGAAYPRLLPDIFELYSKTVERYGAKRLPENHSVQDWGLTWDEIEPYYAKTEKLLGVCGKAGNLKGKKIDGGNIFEGPRSTEYPMPPGLPCYMGVLFTDATKKLGYHPYPLTAAINTVAYTNPDGIFRPACAYCGFCGFFSCMIAAKAQPSNILIPVIQRQKNVSIRTGAAVRRIVRDASKKGRVTGVTYMDENGEEIFQPAEIVFLSSWTFNNTKMLLLSGIGDPYDPATGKGTLGRNLTHQLQFGVQAFFDVPLNRFMGGGVSGARISDHEASALDHSNLPFLRGGTFSGLSGGAQPISAFGVVPNSVKTRWGSGWKKAAIDYYDRTGSITYTGEHMAYKTNFMDLDPVYKDRFGDPLIRLTIDWQDNERKTFEYMAPKAVEIARAMGATDVNPAQPFGRYTSTRYQTTHVQGGTIMAPSPDKGVLNPYLQHWQYPNLFVLGASSFPQQGSANPTSTILALTLRTADAIVDRYLKNPGPLA